MAADARNVRACGWPAEQPLPIDKASMWEALQTTCMRSHRPFVGGEIDEADVTLLLTIARELRVGGYFGSR